MPQELALPVLLDGVNAVVAAETGSGKTVCYLVPIISQLLRKAHSGLPSEQRYIQCLLSLSYRTATCHCLHAQKLQLSDLQTRLLLYMRLVLIMLHWHSTKASSQDRAMASAQCAWQQPQLMCREGSITPGALVLCPNAALCHQVKLVADSLTDSSGAPLLQTAHVSSSSPPPFNVPDILVSTPASLINVTEASHYGPEWTRGGILARYTHAHNIHKQSYAHAHAHTHTQTHIHTYTYTQTHRHTYTQAVLCMSSCTYTHVLMICIQYTNNAHTTMIHTYVSASIENASSC